MATTKSATKAKTVTKTKAKPRPAVAKSKPRATSAKSNVRSGGITTSQSFFKGKSLVTLIAVLLVAILGSIYLVVSHADTANASGLPWASGIWPGDGLGANCYGESNVTKFGTWRGRKIDGEEVAFAHEQGGGWDAITNSYILDACKSHTGALYINVPPIPDNGSTIAACAKGSYNSYWKTFGTNIQKTSLKNSVIRLGWEFNGNWYPWGAANPTDFANCWNQIVGTVKPIAPGLKWNWNPNRGPSNSDATKAWPKDAYVDIVGLDSYNRYDSWNTQLNGTQGLQYWYDFAVKHGKTFAVPEWGSSSESGSNGDQASYVDNMFNFFKSHSAHMAYEAYFNESQSYIQSSIYSPVQKTNTSAEYQKLWKAGAGSGTTTPTPPPTTTPPATSGAGYSIKGIAGKCLDNSSNLKANNNKIQLWNCNGSNSQRWVVSSAAAQPIKNSNGYCLDTASGGTTALTKIVLYQCNGATSQQWTVDSSTQHIRNVKSGLWLHDASSGTNNGNDIILWTHSSSAAQLWSWTITK